MDESPGAEPIEVSAASIVVVCDLPWPAAPARIVNLPSGTRGSHSHRTRRGLTVLAVRTTAVRTARSALTAHHRAGR